MADRRSQSGQTRVSARFGQTSRSPTFSSFLLDAVYRSIDRGEDEVVLYEKAVRTQRRYAEEMADFRGEKVVGRRKANAELQTEKVSEAELFPVRRPKPVRTAVEKGKNRSRKEIEEEAKRGGSSKTKSRALKIYAEMKRLKQPISPGGKLAGIINSLFAGNQKKHAIPSPNSANTSTCSSASSLSRRNLPSSAASKRSVQTSMNSQVDSNSIKQRLTVRIMEKNRRDLIKNDHIHSDELCRDLGLPVDHLRKCNIEKLATDKNFEVDDDDVASYTSSDLFELENLSPVAIGRYTEELPVYETTNLS